jgi:hypothetical protein
MTTPSEAVRVAVQPCAHMNFDAQVSVSRIEDIGRFVAAVTIKCVECGLPFQFVGVQPGFNYDAPTVRLDGLEVDLPICPQGAQPNPLQGLMGYTIKGTN